MQSNPCRFGTALMVFAGWVLLTTATVPPAGAHEQALASAQARLRAGEHKDAKAEAVKARERAQTPEQSIQSALMLAGALAGLGEIDGARAEYRGVLANTDAGDEHKAQAYMGLADILKSGNLRWPWNTDELMEARKKLQAVMELNVSNATKDRAERELLWVIRRPYDRGGMAEYVESVLASEDAWPGRKQRVLMAAGGYMRAMGDFEASRDYFTRITELPDSDMRTVIQAIRGLNRTYAYERKTDEIRQTLENAMMLEGTESFHVPLLQDLAGTYSGEKAREVLNKALAIADTGAQVSVLTDIAGTYRSENDLAGMAGIVAEMTEMEDLSARQNVIVTARVVDLARLAIEQRAYDQAIAAFVTAIERGAQPDVYIDLAQARIIVGDTTGAREALKKFAATPDLSSEQQFMARLQIAGVTGAEGKLPDMRRQLVAEADAVNMPAENKARCYWEAARFFMQSLNYDVVRVFIERLDALADPPKVYACRFIENAPVGVGGWAGSDFVNNPANRESRFYPYDRRSAYLLLTAAEDVAVDRSAHGEADEIDPRETFFSMAYDQNGWHIYVQSDEPLIEQVMAEGGKGSSSLEMFFMPGLEKVAYHQWIIRLASETVNLYNWNSPHRHHRMLKNDPWSFQAATRPMASGWGTLIFIPWESVYDKLPFGENDTWRFSVMRWSPHGSVTWGGRVHESGRWGHIRFDPPTPEQRLSILRHVVRRAWWRYQEEKSEQTDFWTGHRGDADFFDARIKPLFAADDAHAEMIKNLDDLDPDAVERLFVGNVPDWMEFRYKVGERRTAYLLDHIVPPATASAGR